MATGKKSGAGELFIHHPLTGVVIRGGSNLCHEFRIDRVVLIKGGGRNSLRGPGRAGDPRLRNYGRLIRLFLDGKIKDLSAIPVDISGCSLFGQKVLCAARKIRWGDVVSYSGLAKMAGCPKAVRAAASVMRNNPLPLVIPCHRVVCSDGTIGGFMGKQKGREVELKRRLINRERGK